VPSHLALLIPQLSTIAKAAAAQLKDPAMKALGLDSFSKALRKANQSFLELFEAEYARRETLATLLAEEGKKSVSAFIGSDAVQEFLAEALKNGNPLTGNDLGRLWAEISDSNGGKLIPLPAEFDWAELGRSYGAAVRYILATTPELREIWIARNTDEINRNISAIAGVRRKFDLHEYRRLLLEEFGTLKLSALHADLDTKFPDRAVSLESVYIPQRAKEAFPPKDVSRDYRRKLEAEARLFSVPAEAVNDKLIAEYDRAPIQELGTILSDASSRRLVLLGDPGLGKSTLLHHIALQWAEGLSNCVPFVIELRKYTRDHAHPKSFLEFLEKGTWSHLNVDQGELDQFLREMDSWVLFDGLDEIFDEGLRGNVVAEITNFVRSYGRARVAVTTRVMGYAVGSPNPELFQRAGFRQFTLQDFDFTQISQFVSRWYENAICDSPGEREELKERLLGAIQESDAIKELAGNPLLLTLMALLSRRKHLPRERLNFTTLALNCW
jgi:NACHT N-terminal Helical domain 2/NACHT domain